MSRLNLNSNLLITSNPFFFFFRGQELEYLINKSNIYYYQNNIALIDKRPTPIKVVNYNYEINKITNAFFEKKSTTDYYGIYKGRYLDFEAKSTEVKTSFPLKNIKPHQIEYLKLILKHQGIAFFIIMFSKINEVYFLSLENFNNFINKYPNKKSIPLSFFKENGIEIKGNVSCPIDYLKALNF